MLCEAVNTLEGAETLGRSSEEEKMLPEYRKELSKENGGKSQTPERHTHTVWKRQAVSRS